MTASVIGADAKPCLPRGVRLKHDEVREQWVLLAPERIIKLDPIALEILRRCDGEASVEAIVDGLAAEFGAPRDQIDGDVRELMQSLIDKGMLQA